MRSPVLSKTDFVRRYIRGEFGNGPRTWIDLEQFIREADPNGLYHLRIARTGYPLTLYNVPYQNVTSAYEELRQHLQPDEIYISEMGPERLKVFQGELIQSPDWFLKYNNLPMPMRHAFAIQTRYATGLTARFLMRAYLDAESYDWLEYLLEEYPDHVIEFSTYSVKWGTKNWNTVFWEVRKY